MGLLWDRIFARDNAWRQSQERQIGAKQTEKRQIEPKQIEAKQIEKRQIGAKPIEKRQIEAKQIEKRQIEEIPFWLKAKQIEERQIGAKKIEKRQIEAKQIEEIPFWLKAKQIEKRQIEEIPFWLKAKALSSDPYAISDDFSVYIAPYRGREWNCRPVTWSMSKNDGSIKGEQSELIMGRLDWVWLNYEEYEIRAIQTVEKWLISENVQLTVSKRIPESDEPNSNKERHDSIVINQMEACQVVENDQHKATERPKETDEPYTFYHPLNWLLRKKPNLNKERHDSMVINKTEECRRVVEDDRRIATERLQKSDESNSNMSSLDKLLNDMIIEEAESWRMFEIESSIEKGRLEKLNESSIEKGRLEKLDESNSTQNDPRVIDEADAWRKKVLEYNLLRPYPNPDTDFTRESDWVLFESQSIETVEKWFAYNESKKIY